MMAITREQYDYSIKISVPNGITAVSGGELVNRTSTDGETTFYFQSKKPSWRLDIALADYKFLENGKNRIYYFKRDSTRARSIMNDFETSLKLYTNMYGELKNFQGFSIIEVPEGYGSQADVTSILMTADNFEKQDELLTLYHEASHFWNVKPLDAVPCRFESEGLARFSEFLLSEKLNHKENAIQIAAQSNLDQTRKDFLEKPEYQNVPLKDYGIRDMTYYSYNLGMVVFAIYYKLVGQDCFSKTIRSFYSNYYSKGATLDEFINHCKKSASVDLERFFNDWIYTTNAIKLLADGKTFKEFIQYYKGN
jgi:aminopeptidase N